MERRTWNELSNPSRSLVGIWVQVFTFITKSEHGEPTKAAPPWRSGASGVK